MEIGLKERLIGAVVLVILAVIIIPWVLKGGSPSTTVTKSLTLPPATTTHSQPVYHMDLNNPSAATSATQPANVSTPAVQGGAEPRSPESAAAVQPAPKPAESRPAAAQPTPKPAEQRAATGTWVVQAGSYSKEANAKKVQRALAKHGYHVFISRFHHKGHTYYRVRVGPYQDRASAEHAAIEVGRVFGGRAVVVPNH